MTATVLNASVASIVCNNRWYLQVEISEKNAVIKKMSTNATAESRLPCSANINMPVVVDKLPPIPLPALALLRPSDIFRLAFAVNASKSRISLPAVNGILTKSSRAKPFFAFLSPPCSIAQGLESHVPVIIIAHQTCNGTSSRFTLSRCSIIIGLHVEGGIIVGCEMGIDGAGVWLIGTSAS